MKTQNTNFFGKLGKEEMNNLVKEVKETIAVGVSPVNHKQVFAAVDFWNMQKMRKVRIVRRHLV